MHRIHYFALGLVIFMGVLVVFFFLVVSILKNRMILPEQPLLTLKEQKYFETLKTKYRCVVKREVNPKMAITGTKPIAEGWYAITLDSLPESLTQHNDSLISISKNVATQLHTQVLHKSLGYGYKKISVVFRCSTGTSVIKTKGFDYDVAELEP